MNAPLIVRQKAAPEKVCEFKSVSIFPREDNHGTMHVVSPQSGEVFMFNDSTAECIFAIEGQPNCLCFDTSNFMYIADLASKSLLFKPSNLSDGSHLPEGVIAKEYEGKPFKGPTCLTYNKDENCIYFADSGIFEESTLEPFDSSIYSIDLDTRVLRRVLTGLSFVSDICYDHANECLYVAETFMNRIIRLKQNQDGIFHSSVFYQFNGRVGPTALSIDEKGNLYVARMEYNMSEMEENNTSEADADGLISVVNKEGNIVGELVVPKMPEISGLFIPLKRKDNLFFTIRSLAGVFKIKISTFCNDIDKYEQAMKQL